MRRGRPNIRQLVQTNIISVLSDSKTPTTTSTLAKAISKNLNRKLSWNTVQKYLDGLIKIDRIEAVVLPHSKNENKTGLTVYILKK